MNQNRRIQDRAVDSGRARACVWQWTRDVCVDLCKTGRCVWSADMQKVRI